MNVISRLFGRLMGWRSSPSPHVRAAYDAARTTKENSAHWANADDYSANAANSPGVRRTLRKRSRYERGNNSYLNGLVKTIAHDTVGTGPRLQLSLPTLPGVAERSRGDDLARSRGDRELARRVERAWKCWCRAVDLPDKLRVMCEAKIGDGEGFGVLTTNPEVRHPVKLDVRLVEAEQVTTPLLPALDPLAVDGIRFDKFGNPVEYHLLKSHPGDLVSRAPWEYDRVPARNVLHWFRPDRPGQARGVPELTPALPLGAQMRRYTLAVIGAAEFAASLAGVMKSTLPPADGPVAVESMDEIPLSRMNLLTLPEGWDATQFKAEQPTGTYKEFKGEILNEMGRCLNAPFNVVAGNSSGYNYSSGRLDHQIYHRSLWIERERMRSRVLDRLLLAWLDEYLLIPEADGGAPHGLPAVEAWEWDWHWDGFASIDPVKDATAAETRLKLGLSTLMEEAAADGKDWEEQIEQQARERQRKAELGIPEPDAAPQQPAPEEEAANAA